MGASLVVEGSTNATVFHTYLQEVLCPTLERGQVVVMDNLSSHKGERVRELIEAGVTVGMGTDGAGSATTLDMFAEIKAATWMQKLKHGDPTVLPAEAALRMATIESAKLLAIDHEVGTLEAGKRADLILIDLDKPHLQPVHDIPALLAYSATGADVDTTIVNGEILMHQRQFQTLHWEEIKREATARASRLVEGL